jgi:hypothetical protein
MSSLRGTSLSTGTTVLLHSPIGLNVVGMAWCLVKHRMSSLRGTSLSTGTTLLLHSPICLNVMGTALCLVKHRIRVQYVVLI